MALACLWESCGLRGVHSRRSRSGQHWIRTLNLCHLHLHNTRLERHLPGGRGRNIECLLHKQQTHTGRRLS